MPNRNILEISLNKYVISQVGGLEEQAQLESMQNTLTGIFYIEAIARVGTLTTATGHQKKFVIEKFIFDAPRKAPAIAWDIVWDKSVG